MTNEFDYLCDVILHVSEISENLETIASELRKRGMSHDRTKFQQLEFDTFVSTREEFKQTSYGTPEYKAVCAKAQPAMDHHYSNNRHHTAYHENAVNDMNLIDIIELVCDWRAANRRNADQCTMLESVKRGLSNEKYQISEQLAKIIINTFKDLGWI